MYKKLQYSVRLVFALFCISCTLFLNTLQVKASNSGSVTLSGSFYFGFDGVGSGTSGTTIIKNGSGSLHFEIPVLVKFPPNETYDYKKWYDLYLQFRSFTPTISQYAHASVDNIYLKYNNDLTMPTSDQYSFHIIAQGKDLQYANNQVVAPCYICFDLATWSNTPETFQCSWSAVILYAFNSSNYQGDGVIKVEDTGAISRLDDIKNTSEDTNTTTHSIFDSISDFFGSFFSNLIGVFVPEDGFFTTWFNNLNTLLESKLGILYYPFAKVIYLFNQLSTAFSGSANPNITFPAIEFTNSATGETYTFLSDQTVNLNDFNITTTSSANSSLIGSSGYGSLIDIIRTLNGFVLVMALLGLLRQKLNLILRGEDNDS